METFGERLKAEREDRGLSIQAVAETLNVDHDRLRAMERNDFAALPNEATMMDCLAAYAECLKVDAELMIEDYVQERDRCLRTLDEALTAQVASAAIPAQTRRRSRFSPAIVTVVVVAAILLASWWIFSGAGTTPATAPVPAPTAETPAVVAPAEPRAVDTEAPAEVAEARVAPASPSLRVAEHGVGTAIEKRQLVGKDDRFREGTKVWFWTRVQGGTRGDRIDHVWSREGVETARVSLEIGGPNWRTYSTKTLKAGVAGDWAVEVRDGAGRPLARTEFACER